MKITSKEKAMIQSKLRQVFGWSSQYKNTKSRAFLGNNVYKCEGCEELIFKIHSRASESEYAQVAHYARPSKLAVDHKNPVVPLTGYIDDIDWSKNYIVRLFCGEDGLQYLCSDCHYFKTQIENDIRRENR